MKVFAVVLFALSALSGCCNPNGSESAGDKHEWSILQSVEFKHRGQVPKEAELVTVEGYDLLSVPSVDASERIWIMLWPKSPPFYKQMPQGNFVVSRQLLLKLLGQQKISSTVWEALRSHATPSEK